MAKKNIKLKWTLLATYMLIGIIPLVIMTQIALESVQGYFVEERKKELLLQANVISGHISISDYMYDESKAFVFDYDINHTSKQSGYRIMVLDRSGVVVNDSNKTEEGKTYFLPEITDALNNKDVARVMENDTVHAAVSIVDDRSNCIGVVLVCDSVTDIYENVAAIRHKIFNMIMLLMVVVVLIDLFMAWWFTNPLNKTIEVIKKMSDGHFDQRIPVNDFLHTELAELAESSNNMAEQLDRIETSRREFVSNVSHELKTPLSSIKVLSDSILIQDPETVPKEMYVEFLQDINSEVDRMTAIINDLLTLVRMNREEVELKPAFVNLSEMIGDIVRRLEPIAEKNGITLKYNMVDEVTAEVEATKISLAVSNLIENAIKYNKPGGSVTISAGQHDSCVSICVEDTGIGIPEEHQSRVFERFYRVDKSRSKKTGGTGLGLAIVKHIVSLYGGRIRLESQPGAGTRITIEFDIRENE